MRIWSLHPHYLDSKGLTALWRETLLARKVLAGGTKGYKNHPQLLRFKAEVDALAAVNQYLLAVHAEAQARGFAFDAAKLVAVAQPITMRVTRGQLDYEAQHLLNKLRVRDPARCAPLAAANPPQTHPLFVVVEGDVEAWEVVA